MKASRSAAWWCIEILHRRFPRKRRTQLFRLGYECWIARLRGLMTPSPRLPRAQPPRAGVGLVGTCRCIERLVRARAGRDVAGRLRPRVRRSELSRRTAGWVAFGAQPARSPGRLIGAIRLREGAIRPLACIDVAQWGGFRFARLRLDAFRWRLGIRSGGGRGSSCSTDRTGGHRLACRIGLGWSRLGRRSDCLDGAFRGGRGLQRRLHPVEPEQDAARCDQQHEKIYQERHNPGPHVRRPHSNARQGRRFLPRPPLTSTLF